MHFPTGLIITAFLATTALTAPNRAPPPKPAKPTATLVSQTNQCGNQAAPYCCNTDNSGKYTTCKTLGSGSTCGATTVCCNANNSIQICLGDVTIL